MRFLIPVWLAACTLVAGGCGDLSVVPAGCEVVLSGPICELGKDRQLRLFVPQVELEAQLLVLQGVRSVPLTRTEVDGGVLLRFTAGPGVRELRVLERLGFRLRSRRLQVRELQTARFLQDTRDKWEADKVEAAAAALTRELGQPLSGRDRAEALGMLGRIRREQQRNAEAKQLLQEALLADRAAGLVSDEAKDTLALAALLLQEEHRVQAAESLLSAHRAAFQQVPSLQPWVKLHLSSYRKTRGELLGALEEVEEGRKLAGQLGEEQGLGALRQSAATILQSLGRWEEAHAELVGIAEERRGEPCLQANALEMQGWIEIEAREARQPRAEDKDPRMPLAAALRLRRDFCNQGKPIASTLTNLARAALLMAQLPEAADFLAQAQKVTPEPDPALRQQWSELAGLIALQQDPAIAEKHFRELVRLCQASSEKQDLYDTLWRARIGLAQALNQQQRYPEAEEQFRLAEEFLDSRSPELALAEGRVSYLGRHEKGTAAYLELLYAQSRFADALQLIRRARARGLRDLLRLSSLGRLSDEERQRWEVALGEYRAIRAELDANALRLANGAISELKMYKEEQRRLELAMARHLQAALTVLSDPGPQPLHPPAASELLLACHPLSRGYLCLAELGTGPVQAVLLPNGFADGGTELVSSLDAKLQAASKLTVLSYGTKMEQVDFAQLPLRGRPLAEWLSVSYALDMLSPPSAPAGPKVALLAIDPASYLSPTRRPLIAPALRQEPGWKLIELPSDHGVPTERLLSLLGGAELFVYFGHAQVESQVSRRYLQTEEHGGLQVTDVLTLQGVPRLVLLVACESGLAKEESGGVAGLGLAQAFLLRGSQVVIATTRKVDDRLAKAIVEELFRSGMDELAKDPARRLREARKAVQLGADRPESWREDVSAFRLFVP